MIAGPSLVALRLPPGDGWLEMAEQIHAAGDAVLPLPVDAPDPVIAETLRALRPSAVVDALGTTAIEAGEPVRPGTAYVVGTSGSTGTPKGVVLSHDAVDVSARASVARIGANADDRWLCCLPLDHVAGLRVLLRAQVSDASVVIHERFSVRAVAAETSVTMASFVPTMLRRLLDSGADLGHLRRVLLGGAAPGPKLLADAASAGVPVVVTYGMSEMAGGCVYDGVPLDGVDADVDDDGRIRLRGPMRFDGYRLRDDLTDEVLRDGWLRTNDLGAWAADGRLEVLGRADDVIVTGGHNVSAERVAQLLEHHDAIAEVAVGGRDDRDWGQRVVAYVVSGSHLPTLDELRRFLSPHLPAYAAPRELVLLDALPRLPSGKIDRLALRDLA